MSSAAGPVSPLSRVRKLISGLDVWPDSGSRVVLIRSLGLGGARSSDEGESGRAEVDSPPESGRLPGSSRAERAVQEGASMHPRRDGSDGQRRTGTMPAADRAIRRDGAVSRSVD